MLTTSQAYKIVHYRDSEAESYLVEAIREYAQKSEDLLSKVASVRQVCDRVERYLGSDYNLNPLGELQGRAGDFDRLCAERDAAAKHVTRLAWQLRRVGALSEGRMDAILAQMPFKRPACKSCGRDAHLHMDGSDEFPGYWCSSLRSVEHGGKMYEPASR